MKILKYFFFLCIFVGLLVPVLVIESEPMVPATANVTAVEAKQAQELLSQVLRLNNESQNMSLTIENTQVSSAMRAFSYSVPNLDADSVMTQFAWRIVATYQMPIFDHTIYFNVQCLVANGFEGIELDHCEIGDLPLPGNSIMFLLESGLSLVAGKESVSTLNHVMRLSKITSQQLIIENINGKALRESLRAGYSQAKTKVVEGLVANPNLVKTYLAELRVHEAEIENLADAIYRLNVKVAELSNLESDEAIAKQNKAAIRALAVRYGSRHFAQFSGLSAEWYSGKKLTLRGRQDLSLHFIYSAFIQLNSDSRFASGIGELKEVLDTNRGGSGFSFADLVADLAGVRYASYMTDGSHNLTSSILALAKSSDQNLFMPSIDKQLEGLSEAEFKRRFGNIESSKYKKLVAAIEDEIDSLAVYQQ